MSSGFDDHEEEYTVGGSVDRGAKKLEGDEPGCYHLVIDAVKRPALNAEGMPIENAIASINCSVAAPGAAGGSRSTAALAALAAALLGATARRRARSSPPRLADGH